MRPGTREKTPAKTLGLLVMLGLLLHACSIGPLTISIPGRATPEPPIELRWCDQARDVLCLLGFGLEPPDEMVILLLASPGLPAELEATASWSGETGTYPCNATNADSTLMACTGPVIPLGSTVWIEIGTADGKTLIARGEFALNAMALPTVPAGADLPPTDSVTITPRPTRTPASGTPYPNPSPKP